MEYAHIGAERRYLGAAGYETEYQWVGDIRAPVLIDRCALTELGQDPNATWLDGFPWPLRKVEEALHCGGAVYIRADAEARPMAGDLTAARWALRRWGRWLKCRLIWTLAVWGLAREQEGAYPQWSDVGKR